MGQGSFTCVVDLRIADELSAGVVLGKNWLAYHCEYLIFNKQLSENCYHDQGGGSQGISGMFAYSVRLMSKTLLIFIADIKPSCFETIDHSVHHDLRNADLQLSLPCLVLYVRCL